MAKKKTVDEFTKHELLDRVSFVNQITALLENHPAHTKKTKAALKAAQATLFNLYQVVGEMRFDN